MVHVIKNNAKKGGRGIHRAGAHKFKDGVISQGHVHSWEVENGEHKFSCGNLTDAGWYWTGDTSDIMLFLQRMNSSRVREDFLKDLEKRDFNEIRQLLKNEIKKGNDGLYGTSGDNVEWHFGANEWVDYSYEIDELKEQYGLTDEQAKQLDDKITDYWKSGEFEDFEKEYGKDYQEEVLKIVDESKSYKEFMDKIGSEDLKIGVLEDVEEFRHNNFYKAVEKAIKELKFKVKK